MQDNVTKFTQTVTLKLRTQPLIIEVANFDESSELQTPTVYLKSTSKF